MKNEIKIPKRFQIFGQTITVKIKPDLVARDDAKGIFRRRENTIELQGDHPSYPMPAESLEQTYLHEVVHAILGELRYDELTDNEQFVDQFAGCLHQILQTSEYED